MNVHRSRLMIIHHNSNRRCAASNLLDGLARMTIPEGRLPGSKCNQDPGTGNPMEETMRVVALAIASMLAVFVFADTHAQAAKGSSVANPDRQYYQGAARGCGGGAYCYRSGSQKHTKKK
jgi:hypothetical protein